jgi:steroid delta-isomerase-like uncharacterized protein
MEVSPRAAAHRALVARIWDEAWNRGALETVDEVLAEDYVGHIPAMPAPIRGREEFKRLVAAYRGAYGDLHVTVEDVAAAEGDRVVVRWTSRGTNNGPLLGFPPTGRRVEVAGISIFRLEDGLVAEEWEGFDTLAMMEQLGVVQLPVLAA